MNIPESWVGAKRSGGGAGGQEGGAAGERAAKKKKKGAARPPRQGGEGQGGGGQGGERGEGQGEARLAWAVPVAAAEAEVGDDAPAEVPGHEALYNELRCAIRSSGAAGQEEAQPGLSLDCIITRQPYARMMQSLFGAYDESCFAQVPPVKVVTRAWEEMHMREPQEGERACSMGINCECMFIDPALPFVCVEFQLPNEPLQIEQQLCVLCLRKLTQCMFYEVVYRNVRFNGVIQSHGNICDQPGEYAKQVMLTCPVGGPVHCMPLPIVAHQRNRYSVCLNNVGIKYLRQHRVGWEDFRSAPPGA